jgi:hypothetical protein
VVCADVSKRVQLLHPCINCRKILRQTSQRKTRIEIQVWPHVVKLERKPLTVSSEFLQTASILQTNIGADDLFNRRGHSEYRTPTAQRA